MSFPLCQVRRESRLDLRPKFFKRRWHKKYDLFRKYIMLQSLLADFQKLADPAHAVGVSRFFKCGKGEYGEWDLFLGLYVPQVRVLSKQYKDLPLADIETLITSPIHEYRLLAVFILTIQYERALKTSKISSRPVKGGNEGGLADQIIFLYLANKAYINNWDLVDLSAPRLLWRSILEAIIANEKNVIPAECHPRFASCGRDLAGIQTVPGDPAKILHTLSHSTSLRDRRISIISTFTLLRAGLYDDTLEIAETLLTDTHDLIHKAVGRMLREIGKRCKPVEDGFLKKHYKVMPRTMLRYAIEKYPEEERLRWLKGDM